MSTKRTKYLSYIEETPKHFGKIEKLARAAAKTAIQDSIQENIPFTYAEGDSIVKEHPDGHKEVLGTIPEQNKKVRKGDIHRLPEE